jgi:hypothetical protein
MATTATQDNVVYAARTKLLDLAYQTASTRNLLKVSKEIQQGTNIFLWLSALDSSAYLTFLQREKIWTCLREIADINELPVAPLLGVIGRDVTIGGGNTITNIYNYDNGTIFENADADTGTENADSLPVTDGYGAVWFYTIRKTTNQRSGVIQASWLSDGSSIVTQHDSTNDIGTTTGVTLSVDYSGGNIRLRITADSDNWIISGRRYISS